MLASPLRIIHAVALTCSRVPVRGTECAAMVAAWWRADPECGFRPRLESGKIGEAWFKEDAVPVMAGLPMQFVCGLHKVRVNGKDEVNEVTGQEEVLQYIRECSIQRES